MPRIFSFIACLATAVLGYWLRFSAPVPEWLRDASGGAAYVVFWMLAWLVIRPATSPARLALAVLAATCAIEFLQTWHPGWLEAIRRTLPGRLVLGTTFSWTDFPPYFAGAILGWIIARGVTMNYATSGQRART